jgi:hypothetical protein
MARRPSPPRAFENVITLAIARVKSPEVQRLHARIAREGLAKHLASRDDKPNVTRIVDGRVGASEDTVKPYGVIRYEFDNLRSAALFAMEQIQALVPVLTGRYKGQWFFLLDGAEVAPEAIPPTAREITITNDEPYSRRLVVGRRRDGSRLHLRGTTPDFLQVARYAVIGRFGNSVTARVQFILLNQAPGRTAKERAQQMTYPSLVLKAV